MNLEKEKKDFAQMCEDKDFGKIGKFKIQSFFMKNKFFEEKEEEIVRKDCNQDANGNKFDFTFNGSGSWQLDQHNDVINDGENLGYIDVPSRMRAGSNI